MGNKVVITESKFKSIIKEEWNRVLNESFKSKELQKLFKSNYVKDSWENGMHHAYNSNISYNNMWSNWLSDITDDMTEGVYRSPEEAGVKRSTPYMRFANGMTVFNNKIHELDAGNEKKMNDRWNRVAIDQYYKDHYKSRNPYYNDYMNGRGMWKQDIKNGDSPYFRGSREVERDSTPLRVKDSYYNAAREWYKGKR